MINVYGPYFNEKELRVENAPDDVRESMYLLVKLAMNVIRKKYGPTVITSGYRDPGRNARVGGVKTSQHQTGEACDFVCPHAKMREVFEWLREWWPGQLFYYQKKGHVHIGLPTIDLQKRQRLYALVFDK